MGTLGSGRYAPYAQRPHGRFVHHVEGHKQNFDAEALYQIRKMSKSFESVRRVWHDFQKRSGLAGTE